MKKNLRRKVTLGYEERYFAVIPKANAFFLMVQRACTACDVSLQVEFPLGGDFQHHWESQA
jgi:hypothetical protein